MSVTFDYRGKFVFVAGGTSGINLGVAHAFARCGARIAVLSRSQDKVDAAVAELKRHGGDAVGFSADVRDYAKTEEALRSEEHTSELQSLMRISYAVFCLKKKKYKELNLCKCM